MKKISWAFVTFILLFSMALGGCGTSDDSSTYADTVPAVAADTAAESDAVAAGAASDGSAVADFYEEQLEKQENETWAKAPDDADIPELTIDEVIEDVLNYAEGEGMSVVGQTVDINEKIRLLYIAEGYGAFEIFQYLCDEGDIVSVPVEPHGILVLHYVSEEPYFTSGSSITENLSSFTVKIDSIDPDTGNVQNLRTFPVSGDNVTCCLSDNGSGRDVSHTLALFNTDLTQMAVTKIMEDGSEHAGWIDEKGNFTDVSRLVTADAGDFGGITKHGSPFFTSDGCFCFADSTDSPTQIKKVPLENLTVSAAETVDSVDRYLYLSSLPDGTITVETALGMNYDYYNEGMTFPARTGWFYDWISENQCVGVENNRIYKYMLSGNTSGLSSWYNEQISLIPDIKGRWSWDPVASPDADRVAFLSKLTEGTDQSAYLYIVPVEGGNPVKVSTDYLFADGVIMRVYDDQKGIWRTYPVFTLMTWE